MKISKKWIEESLSYVFGKKEKDDRNKIENRKGMKSFEDVYRFPLKMWDEEWSDRVVDSVGNFVFQFETGDLIFRKKLLGVMNERIPVSKRDRFYREGVHIRGTNSGEAVILIRGWSNLTGTGAMNLPPEEAKNIQDTFGDFLIWKLNGEI